MDDAFFAQNSLVEVNVPEDPALDIESALSSSDVVEVDEDNVSLIPSIPERAVLYFDETIPIYIVVRVPREDEATLKSRIHRFAITAEAHAHNDAPLESSLQEQEPQAPAQDVVWTGKLSPWEEPIIVLEDSPTTEEIPTALLIWKLTAKINRPKVRLQSPAIFWKISALLEGSSKARASAQGKYLASGKPLPLNLLEPLKDEPSLNGRLPYLSATRLAKPPRSSQNFGSRSYKLQILEKNAIRTIPALSSRIRFHRSHRIGKLPTIAASLELEFPPYASSDVDVLSISLDLARGKADPMGKEHGVQLPRTCHGHDYLVWFYMLSPLEDFEDPTAQSSLIRTIDVEIQARALVSDICRPEINIKWRTNVDFGSAAHTVRAALDFPPDQPKRPLSHVRPGSNSDKPSPRVSIETNSGAPGLPEFTVTLTSSGPVYVGEPFKWEAVIVNRSNQPRPLALTVLQKRRRQSAKRHSHQSSTGSVTAVSKSGAIADPFVDDNLLYATIKSGGPDATQLVCLNADVRVGPLAPGAAASVELEFLPMVKGYLQPDAIRVTDMATNDFCDIKQFPDIIALERGADEGTKE